MTSEVKEKSESLSKK